MTITDYLASLKAFAPTCKNFAALAARAELEHGKSAPGHVILKMQLARYEAGQNLPKAFRELFDSIGTAAKAAEKPAALTASAIGASVIRSCSSPDAAIRAQAQAGLAQIVDADALARRLGLRADVGPTCTRAEFGALSQNQRAEFSLKKGRIAEPEPLKAAPIKAGQKLATRAEFNATGHAERAAFFKAGGKLTV